MNYQNHQPIFKNLISILLIKQDFKKVHHLIMCLESKEEKKHYLETLEKCLTAAFIEHAQTIGNSCDCTSNCGDDPKTKNGERYVCFNRWARVQIDD